MVRQIDIARKTGLSLAAVSRALSPNKTKNDNLAEETRNLIRQTARDMGYSGSRLEATSLRRGRTPSIRVLLPNWRNDQLCELTHGIAKEARLCGYPLTFHFFDWNDNDYLDFVRQMNREKNTGVIFYMYDRMDAQYLHDGIGQYCDNGGKIVLLNNKNFHIPDEVSLNADEVRGGELAAEYLLNQDCRTYFCWHSERSFCQLRQQGFKRMLSGQTIIDLAHDPRHPTDTNEFVKQIVQHHSGRSGIFFTRGQCANRILFELTRYGLEVNRDLFPIRFDNIMSEDLPIFSYPCVLHPYEQMGHLAMKKLSGLLNGRPEFPEILTPIIIQKAN